MTVLTPPGTGLRLILDLEGTPSSSAANGMWPARSGPISVLLVGESVETRVADGVLFGGALAVAGESPIGGQAISLAHDLKPDVILVALEAPLDEPLHLVERLSAAQFEPVVCISSDGNPATIRQAMAHGARAYVVRPSTAAELEHAIVDAFERERQRRTLASVLPAEKRGQVVTIFGAKGGIGRTTMATNLATSIARLNHTVALVDLDTHLGDVALFLNLKPERTLGDLQAVMDKLEPDLIQPFLSVHDSGVRVLAAPFRPEEGEHLQPADVGKILRVLSEGYDYVVVDTPRDLNDNVIALLDMSDLVCLLTTNELACLKSTRVYLDVMRGWEYGSHKLKLVVNQSQQGVTLPADDTERTLDYPIFWKIPYGGRKVAASQWTQPFVLSDPKSGISRNLTRLATAVAGAPARKKGFLPWRRK